MILVFFHNQEYESQYSFFERAEAFNEILSLVEQLKAKKLPYRILFTVHDDKLINYFESQNIPYDIIKLNLPKNKLIKAWQIILFSKKLARYFKMYHFDLVHCFGVYASLFSIPLKIVFNAGLVWQISSRLSYGFFLGIFRALASLFSDNIIVPSLEAAHPFGRLAWWRGKLLVSYPGLREQEYSLEQQMLSQLKQNTLKFGLVSIAQSSVSRFANVDSNIGLNINLNINAKLNGYKTFLRAISLVQRGHENVSGTIYEFVDELSASSLPDSELTLLLESFNLKSCIEVKRIEVSECNFDLRVREFLADIYKRSICALVVPSAEGTGTERPVLEAMNIGCPVIASRAGMLTEYITHEHTGLLFNVGDANDLFEQLTKVIKSSEFRIKLASNGLEEVRSRFPILRKFELIFNLYGELLSHHQIEKLDQPSLQAEGMASKGKKAA